MLQVARLAPNLLHEAADAVVEYLQGELNEDGGARDRAGESDLYYTAFLLDGLVALRAELPLERVLPYLHGFGDGAELDLVHQACLARCWAAVGEAPDDSVVASILGVIESYRSTDGGYGVRSGADDGTVYNAFLSLGVYQDLGRELPDPGRLGESIARLRAADGGYADIVGLPFGTTPTTAAAVTLLRHLNIPPPASVGRWLLERAHPKGGFLAIPQAPIPDLLSTATALHALASLNVPFDAVRERCLDFIDTLWTGRGFCGHWHDDELDCEYAFYALLALGHLSL
jgi:hypothetical protein